MKNIVVIFLAVFGFYYSQLVFAASLPAPYVGTLNSVGKMAYYGSPAYTKAQKAMGVQNRWNPDLLASTQTGVRVTQYPKIPTAAGSGYTEVAVSGLATAAGVFLTAKTIAGAVVGGPVGIGLTALTLAPAIVEYFSAPDARLGPLDKRDSSLPFEVPGPGSGGIYWNAVPVYGEPTGYGYSSAQQACIAAGTISRAWMISENSTTPNYQPNLKSPFTYDGTNCMGFSLYGEPRIVGSTSSKTVTGDGPWVPAGWDGIEAAMKARAAALTPGMIDAIIEAGGEIPLESPAATGPASVTGVPTVKSANDGTNTKKETTTPKTTLEYSTEKNPEGQDVPRITTSTSNVTVNTTTNNSTNVTTTTNTTTETKPQDTPEEDLGTITDTLYGPIPDLYERKYPDGIKGVWDDKIAAIKAAPLFTLVGSLMPTNIGSSGSCPSFMIPVNFGQWGEYGNLDFSPPCMVWDFGKVIIIISSLLLARRLIFGG